ncbi:MAG: ferredoxin [Nanoarchaeota archaeon]
MATYQIKLDQGSCIGAASCVKVNPRAFVLNNGKASVLTSEFGDAELNKNVLAARGCPVNAIKIINKDTNKEIN